MRREGKQRTLVTGYTLIEMLVVLAIVSLLFSAVFGVLNIGNTSFNTGFVRQEIENQARQGLDNMLRELYETSGGWAVLSGANSVITFRVPVKFDDKDTLLWGAQGIENYKISYLVDNNQLIRKVLDSSDNLISQKVLAMYIESLLFVKTDSIMTVTLKVKKKITGIDYVTQSVSSKVAFRN